jgi:2-keto-4-pentenoate hydratase/2-oxohepta-3-ene-1,7-dioic acid hydratase in catechol pathway
MKLAAYQYQAEQYVGVISQDLQTVAPYQLSKADAVRGALAIIELMAEEKPLPAFGSAVALKDVCLLAPIPKPKRNIFCVGKNYFEHAKEFSGSGFDSSVTKPGDDIPQDPIIFTKVP